MERANSRAAAINADRLRAAKPGNDSKGREKKRRRKNDRLPQMEKGEGRDRVASHGGGGCWRSCRDSAAPNHTRGGGATAAFIDSSMAGNDEGRSGEEKTKRRKDKQRVWFCIIHEDRFLFPPG